MKQKSKVFLILIGILFVLLVLVFIILSSLKATQDVSNSISFPEALVTDVNNKTPGRTVKEIIEDSGSKYISRTGRTIPVFNVEFKCDLYDKNGRSQKTYFYDLIEELVPEVNESFYLSDDVKKIKIFVGYDPATDTYKITINEIDNFYETTEGEDYVNVEATEITKQSDFAILDPLFNKLATKNMYYSNTILASEDRVEMPNGYYSYDDGTIYAKLAGGRVLNTILTTKYEEEIALNTKVGTSLVEIDKYFSNRAFGSVKDGYLGYRTNSYYVFIYDDQISIYEYMYKKNDYFDKYLKDYCETGDLDKLYSDFTTAWSSYFEKEYDPNSGRLKITFPTRGIDIDIVGNDSRGIKIYSNYYLTDTVKNLIKKHKITLESDKDLIQMTEVARRENWR